MNRNNETHPTPETLASRLEHHVEQWLAIPMLLARLE